MVQQYVDTDLAGGLARKTPVQTSAGVGDAGKIPALNSAGVIDQTMLPAVELTTMLASESLSAGALVNIWSNAGVESARNADGSTTGKIADGYVLAAVTSGQTATVYMGGVDTGATGLTIGANVYLSDVTPGLATATAPSTAGHTLQRVGRATSATSFVFDPATEVTL
jgi:hypothetical protein